MGQIESDACSRAGLIERLKAEWVAESAAEMRARERGDDR